MDTDLDDDSIQMEDIKHVWYFEPVLEHICHKSPSNEYESVFRITLMSGSVWSSVVLVYYAQFSSVTIYKVNKYIPSILKPLQILKVVYCIPVK